MAPESSSPEPAPFPLEAPPFDGSCRVAPAEAAVQWLRYGWDLFVRAPGPWLAMAVVFIVLLLVAAMVPLVGGMAAHLLMPLLTAGMLAAARRQDEGGPVELNDLFIGFKRNSSGLVLIGVFYMLGWGGILIIGFILGGSAMMGGLVAGTPGGFGFALGGLLLALLLGLALSVPLLMAVWFAPPLVLFNNMEAIPALKASFHACLQNMLVFLVYGLIVTVLAFVAALPMGLGFLVLGPVLFASLYASYRDIFPGA